jgi:hypothetical protein
VYSTVVVLMLSLVVLRACSPPPELVAIQPLPDERYLKLREESREHVGRECGSCHTSTLATAKPGAIAVFDLVKEDWAGDMSQHDLSNFNRRVGRFDDSANMVVREFLGMQLTRLEARSDTTSPDGPWHP